MKTNYKAFKFTIDYFNLESREIGLDAVTRITINFRVTEAGEIGNSEMKPENGRAPGDTIGPGRRDFHTKSLITILFSFSLFSLFSSPTSFFSFFSFEFFPLFFSPSVDAPPL